MEETPRKLFGRNESPVPDLTPGSLYNDSQLDKKRESSVHINQELHSEPTEALLNEKEWTGDITQSSDTKESGKKIIPKKSNFKKSLPSRFQKLEITQTVEDIPPSTTNKKSEAKPDSSELNKRLESSLHISQKLELKSKEMQSNKQYKQMIKKSIPPRFQKPEITQTVEDIPTPVSQENDVAKPDFSENASELNKRLETSLHISRKPELKSKEIQYNEQYKQMIKKLIPPRFLIPEITLTVEDIPTPASIEHDDTKLGSSDNVSKLNRRLETSLHISQKPELKSKEAQSNKKCNPTQPKDFKMTGKEVLPKNSNLKEIQQKSKKPLSQEIQKSKTPKAVKDIPSPASKKDETKPGPIDNDKELNKGFESSLPLNQKPELKSKKAQSNEKCNTTRSSDFKKGGKQVLPDKSNLKEKRQNRKKPLSQEIEKSKPSKTVEDIPSPANKKDEPEPGPLDEGIGLNKRFESSFPISQEARKETNEAQSNEQCNATRSSDVEKSEKEAMPKKSNLKKKQQNWNKPILQGIQKSESLQTDEAKIFHITRPNLCPPSFFPEINPAATLWSTYPVQNRALTNPESAIQNTVGRNIAYGYDTNYINNLYQTVSSSMNQNNACTSNLSFPRYPDMNSNQFQIPLANNRTGPKPVLLPRSGTSHFNQIPYTKTGENRNKYVPDIPYGKNLMSPIKTNATPIAYVQPKINKSEMSASWSDAASKQLATPVGSSYIAERKSFPLDAIKSRYSTPVPDFTLSEIQHQKYAPKQDNNLTRDLRITKTKLEMLAERTHNSRTNLDIPMKDSPTSFFSLGSTFEGRLAPRQMQKNCFPFPPPLISSQLGSNLSMIRGMVPDHLHRQTAPNAQKDGYSNLYPAVVSNEAVSQPMPTENFLFQFGSASCNLSKPDVQEQSMTTQNYQFQSTVQNELFQNTENRGPNIMHQHESNINPQYNPYLKNQTLEPKYQYPNNPMYKYETKYQPGMQSLTAAESEFLDPNTSMYQHRIQYKPSLQNQTEEPQYQDPNNPMYQHGLQFRPALQNPSQPQCQDPNNPMYQHGLQFQPDLQNPTEPQYQDPNNPMYQQELKFRPALQNPSQPQCRDTNNRMYQHALQFQPVLQNSTEPQYQDPNNSMYQQKLQFRPALQNSMDEQQYQDPNYLLEQHKTLKRIWSSDALSYTPPHDPCNQTDNSNVIRVTEAETNIFKNSIWQDGS